jgi:proton-translocating NADH-quinone oxidoreductase chain L
MAWVKEKSFRMYLLIVLFPLLGFCGAAGFGRWLGYRGAALYTTTLVSLSACLSFVAFYEIGICGSPCYITLAPWFFSEMFDASWGFLFDSLTAVMLVVVTFVSTLVHIYSISYMGEDPHLPRFMSYLSLFTFFMLMLVTGDNFLQMFLGWEGVGLASYLLINFWFTRLQANKSAIKAMLVNRVGDFGLALGIMGIFAFFKTVDFQTVFACAHHFANTSFLFCTFEYDLLTVLCCLLFIGAIGKSAQLGLHTWLPDAMEGPTPVSALIHAATMVTAGVFMIARCSPLFEFAPEALCVVTFVGAMTSFFAATTGVVQNDLKRVIAYSTCSQLGYMVFACGLSHYSVGVFHLMNHAFFKALLFLSAGSVIHAVADEQDMRKMGGLIHLLPFTYAMMFIGSLALIGFPFLTGFYSKDVILEVAFAKYTVSGNFAYWLGSISALFTSYYSFRLLILTFLGTSNLPKPVLSHVHDAPIIMAIPLILLSFGSIFVGYLARDMMIGLGTDFWGSALFILPQNIVYLESEYIPQVIKMVPLVFSALGAFLAYGINRDQTLLAYSLKMSAIGKTLYLFLNKRWLFDKVYNDFLAHPSLTFGYHVSFKSLDKGVIEIFGPYGIAKTFQHLIVQMSHLQSGFIYHYALIMLLSVTLFMAFIGGWDILSYWVDSRLYFLLLISFVLYTSFCKDEANLAR